MKEIQLRDSTKDAHRWSVNEYRESILCNMQELLEVKKGLENKNSVSGGL